MSMASVGPTVPRTPGVASYRNRPPRKLNYLSCTFCRSAKVKVYCQDLYRRLSRDFNELMQISVYQYTVRSRRRNAIDVLRRILDVRHLNERRRPVWFQDACRLYLLIHPYAMLNLKLKFVMRKLRSSRSSCVSLRTKLVLSF
jgi:hypothetical protein